MDTLLVKKIALYIKNIPDKNRFLWIRLSVVRLGKGSYYCIKVISRVPYPHNFNSGIRGCLRRNLFYLMVSFYHDLYTKMYYMESTNVISNKM